MQALATLIPISTEGPSGPRLQPLPSVAAEAADFLIESIRSRIRSPRLAYRDVEEALSTRCTTPRNPGWNEPSDMSADTTNPPKAGISTTKLELAMPLLPS